MNKFTIIAAAATMGLLLTASPAAAQAPAGGKGQPRIAVVDMDKILNAYNKKKDAEKTLQGAMEAYQKDRQNLEQEGQKMMDEARKLSEEINNPATDEKTKDEKKKLLQEKGVEVQMKRQQFMEMVQSREMQLGQQRARIMENLYDDISKATGETAKKLGYNLVLDRTKGKGIIYADGNAPDISDDVVATLNSGAAPKPVTK